MTQIQKQEHYSNKHSDGNYKKAGKSDPCQKSAAIFADRWPAPAPCPDFPAFGLFFIFFVSKIITVFILSSPLELDGVIL